LPEVTVVLPPAGVVVEIEPPNPRCAARRSAGAALATDIVTASVRAAATGTDLRPAIYRR
jgi:hypothetical protein